MVVEMNVGTPPPYLQLLSDLFCLPSEGEGRQKKSASMKEKRERRAAREKDYFT